MAAWERSWRGWPRRAKRGVPTSSLRAQTSSSESRRYGEPGAPGSSAWPASGMSASSSSSTSFWAFCARGLSVVTSMPSRGRRQHDGARVRSPFTSTTQARQLPSGRMPSL